MGAVLHTVNLRLGVGRAGVPAAPRRGPCGRSPTARCCRSWRPSRTSSKRRPHARRRRHARGRRAASRRSTSTSWSASADAGVRLAGRRRAVGGDTVLHERDDRTAEGRGVQPSIDVHPHAGAVFGQHVRDQRARPRADGRADVPRQRVGIAVLVLPVGRRHGDAGRRPLAGGPGRCDRSRAGDVLRRGPDDRARPPPAHRGDRCRRVPACGS